MPWFKVDDKLHDHHKARQAGKAAMGVWALAGSWSADNLADGFVPESVLPRWGTRTDARRLVQCGLWHPAQKNSEQGWQFHDWDEYQLSSEQVKAERAAARERQRRARELAKSRRDSRRDSQAGHSVSHGPPDPTRPDPTRPDPTTDVDGYESSSSNESNARGLRVIGGYPPTGSGDA